MTGATPQATLRLLATILEQGDWTALEAHPGMGETRQHFPAMLAAFPDLRHTIETEVVAGEMIATVVTARGTHRAAFLGIPATGKQVQFMVLGIDRVVDGKIVQHWALPDWMAIIHQLDATIQPSAARQADQNGRADNQERN
jgi:predicted ester cyclase